ncbi:MAG: MASE2 domain-containing protein, partial [Marinobacter sp.]
MMSAPVDLRNVASSTGKLSPGEISDHTVAIPPMPDYNGRILAYTASAAIVVTGVLQDTFQQGLLWIVAVALIWPHLAHLLTRRSFLRRSPRIRQKMLFFDCIIGGLFIGLIGLVAIPSASVVLMLMFSCLIVGGIRHWLFGTALLSASLIASAATLGIADSLQSPLLTSLIAVVSTGTYICLTAYYSHQQARA